MESKRIPVASLTEAKPYLSPAPFVQETFLALQSRTEKPSKIEYCPKDKQVCVSYELVPGQVFRLVFFSSGSASVYSPVDFHPGNERDGVRSLINFLFETSPRHVTACLQASRLIDEGLGPLAVRLVHNSYDISDYEAGELSYKITDKGTVRVWYPYKKEYSVKDAIPVLREASDKAFPFVTRTTRPVTNILYIYKPLATNSKCPRQDVLAHFRAIIDQINNWKPCRNETPLFEPGTVSDYRAPQSTFNKANSWRGYHTCEGKCSSQPRSHVCDYHLVHQGQATGFATNTLALHYLEEHWEDVCQDKEQLARLGKYLKVVGIAPID